MKQGLILLLALCSLAACMVPRDRRAVNTEEAEEQLRVQSTQSTTMAPNTTKTICASQTPCMWAIYKFNTRYVYTNVKNSYCECGPDTVCQNDEDDATINAYVYHCRPVATATTEETVES